VIKGLKKVVQLHTVTKKQTVTSLKPTGLHRDPEFFKASSLFGNNVLVKGHIELFNLISLTLTFLTEKCRPGYFSPTGLAKCFPCPSGTYAAGLMNANCTSCPAGTTTILPAAGGREECGSK